VPWSVFTHPYNVCSLTSNQSEGLAKGSRVAKSLLERRAKVKVCSKFMRTRGRRGSMGYISSIPFETVEENSDTSVYIGVCQCQNKSLGNSTLPHIPGY
jgi:hypothetical protein